jgi:hypothetical protein
MEMKHITGKVGPAKRGSRVKATLITPPSQQEIHTIPARRRPRGQPPCSEDGEERAAFSGPADPGLQDVRSQGLR